MPDFTQLNAIPQPLLAWYEQNRRILPWREDPQPYHVWLSEMMLQQTRVDAVIPYYLRFLQALPTIASLAEAPEEQLLKLWEGLGYYSRVRNLQRAAQIVVREHGGALPRDYEQVLALPGIGEYTAGAICSIAFGLPTPAVDGNVLRVISRVLGDASDITRPQVKAGYRQALAGLYPAGRAGDFTQALMELGATVCLPNGAPKCLLCPLRGCCAGYASGDPMALPHKPPKKQRRVEQRQVWLVFSPAGVLLHRRPDKGLLAGLWELPNTLKEEEPFPLAKRGLSEPEPVGAARHIFTHVQWEMQGLLCTAPRPFPVPEGWRWANLEELEEEIALPSAFSAFRPLVLEHLQ